MAVNSYISLTQYQPTGAPESSIWALKYLDVPQDVPAGSFLLRLEYVSADPYMSFRVRQAGGEGEFAGFYLEKPITGYVVGVVEKANSEKVKVGDVVSGWGDYQKYQVLSDSLLDTHLSVVTGIYDDHLSYFIGSLGMPGATAYYGLNHILEARPGQVLFISGAAGAVGSLLSQLAKAKGLTVIGSAGTKEKCEKLVSYGYDHTFNYKDHKTVEEVVEKLKSLAPEGIDLYFDNVGGVQLQAAIQTLRQHGRIAICGQISQYGSAQMEMVPNAAFALLGKEARMEGMLVFTFLAQHEKVRQFQIETAQLIREGKLRADEMHFTSAQFGEAMGALFTGANFGKVVVKFE